VLTEEQAKNQAINILKTLRYDNNNNYFWINDSNPVMLMHISAALIGKNVGHLKDIDGTEFFIDMVKIVQDKGEGFVPYKWNKPGFDEPIQKVSFIKGFSPWKWILGSGTYIDDIDAT
jgi:methyl-accepting chemotaxis protein